MYVEQGHRLGMLPVSSTSVMAGLGSADGHTFSVPNCRDPSLTIQNTGVGGIGDYALRTRRLISF